MTAAPRAVALAVVSLLASVVAPASASAAAAVSVNPGPRSPIATDGPNVYAVGADRQTLLMARPGKGEWSAFTTVPGAEIRGLAWANGHLFFTSATDASLQFVSTTDRDRKPVLVHRGAPFVKPGELTYASGLIVADPGAGTLFRVSPQGTPGLAPVTPAPLRTDIKVSEGTFLAAWGTGEVLISDGDSGFLGQLTAFTGPDAKLRTVQTKAPGADTTVSWRQRSQYAETVRRKGYPGIDHPSAIAAYNGVLYAIDAKSGALFAAGIYDARAIKIPIPVQNSRITRLIANPVALTALDESGRLHTWPRVVPSELTLLPAARLPQSLFPVLEYLHARKLIETRPVEVKETLDKTLSDARMSWPGRGTPIEEDTPESRYASFCLFNPTLCTNGLPRPLEQGSTIALASLYAERFTIATQVELRPSQTLGEVVDKAIESEEFSHLKTEAYLRRVNGLLDDDARVLREATTGTFRIALEQTRYVVPIETTELRPDTEFQRLRERVKGTLRIVPLERILNAASAADDAPGLPQSEALASRALAALLEAINYAPTKPSRVIYVGVAENEIDSTHPDFVVPTGALPVLKKFSAGGPTVDAPVAPTPASAPCPPPPAADPSAPSDGAPRVTWRDYHDCDHGTAIASIIGGRTSAYREGFGFTRAYVGMLSRTELNALADDIGEALKNEPMTVVNLSLSRKLDRLPSTQLGLAIEESARNDTALFVISAPNSASQVDLCTPREDWYPACYAKQYSNVLVVGGTTLDGKAIHDRSPKGQYVHLFAPEVGYFAAGRHNSYVEVVGTSFATALVSAAAALLSSAGVKSPVLIKQRLMSTAKVIARERAAWARVLDVRKAVTHFRHALLVDAGTKRERPVTVLNRDEDIKFRTADNKPLPVPILYIRRLKRVEGNSALYDLAYISPDGTKLEERAVKAPADGIQWKLRYLPLDDEGMAAGLEASVDLAGLFDYVGPIDFQ